MDVNGQPAGSDECERLVVRSEFMTRLNATQCTFQSLIDEDRDTCASVAGANASTTLNIMAVPFFSFSRGGMLTLVFVDLGRHGLEVKPTVWLRQSWPPCCCRFRSKRLFH